MENGKWKMLNGLRPLESMNFKRRCKQVNFWAVNLQPLPRLRRCSLYSAAGLIIIAR